MYFIIQHISYITYKQVIHSGLFYFLMYIFFNPQNTKGTNSAPNSGWFESFFGLLYKSFFCISILYKKYQRKRQTFPWFPLKKPLHSWIFRVQDELLLSLLQRTQQKTRAWLNFTSLLIELLSLLVANEEWLKNTIEFVYFFFVFDTNTTESFSLVLHDCNLLHCKVPKVFEMLNQGYFFHWYSSFAMGQTFSSNFSILRYWIEILWIHSKDLHDAVVNNWWSDKRLHVLTKNSNCEKLA